MTTPTHRPDFLQIEIERKEHKKRVIGFTLAAAFAGIAIGGAVATVALKEKNGDGTQPPVVGGVATQVVKTVFVVKEPADSRIEDGTVYIQQPKMIHSETIKGSFAPDQAYRYDIVVASKDDRSQNRVIRFTSSFDLLNENNRTAQSYGYDQIIALSMSQTRTETSLDKIDEQQREDLSRKYRASVAANSPFGIHIPAGLVSPSLYLKEGVDGFSFQARKEIMNFGNYYRDVAGVYANGKVVPGKKVITEMLVWGAGKFCTVTGEAGEYEDVNKNPQICRKIGDMTDAEMKNLKSRAQVFGMDLVDADLHSTVRNASGKIIADDITKTLVPRTSLHSTVRTAASIEWHEQVTLTAKQGIYSVCTEVFAKGSLGGKIPDIAANGQWKRVKTDNGDEYESTFNRLDEPQKVTSECSTGQQEPGYVIRYIDDRFKAHGINTYLPRRHINVFGY